MRNKWHKIVDKVVPGHIRSGTFLYWLYDENHRIFCV